MPEIKDLNSNANFYKDKKAKLDELRKQLADIKKEYDENKSLKWLTEESKKELDLTIKAYKEADADYRKQIEDAEMKLDEAKDKEIKLDLTVKKTPKLIQEENKIKGTIERLTKRIEDLETQRDKNKQYVADIKAKHEEELKSGEKSIQDSLAKAKEVCQQIKDLEEELQTEPTIRKYAGNKIASKYQENLDKMNKLKEENDRVEEVRDIVNNDPTLSGVFTKMAKDREIMAANAKYAEMDPAPEDPGEEPKEPKEPVGFAVDPGDLNPDWDDDKKAEWAEEKKMFDAFRAKEDRYQKKLDQYKEDKKAYKEKADAYNGYKAYKEAKEEYEAGLTTASMVGLSKEETEKLLDKTQLSEDGKFVNNKKFEKEIAGVDRKIDFDQRVINKAKEGPEKVIEEEETPGGTDSGAGLPVPKKEGFFGKIKGLWGRFKDKIVNSLEKHGIIDVEYEYDDEEEEYMEDKPDVEPADDDKAKTETAEEPKVEEEKTKEPAKKSFRESVKVDDIDWSLINQDTKVIDPIEEKIVEEVKEEIKEEEEFDK